MANEQLKQALRSAGIEIDELATKVGVDTKTAQRWLTGRTPYPRLRRRVADTLGIPERVLWPDEVPDQDRDDQAGSETADVFSGGSPLPDWRHLLSAARERVDLLDLTLGDVIADGDGQLLADAAVRGCRVRVLVSDRDSVHLAIAEQDAGREVNLASRPASTGELDRVVKLLSSHGERGELELRRFVGAGAYRVLLFDDQALVRLRLPGIDREAMPTLHLTREKSEGTLDTFSQHFDALWQSGEPLS